jgi:Protein of unknown function (DUF4231)
MYRWPWHSRKQSDDAGVSRKYAALHGQLLQIYSQPDRQTYITGRWLDAVTGARKSMKRDQRWFRRANLLALGAAAITPVLITATAATAGVMRTVLTVSAVCLSLLAAAGGVLLQTLRPGIRWRLHRKLRDDLEAIAWRQLTLNSSTANTRGEDGWASFAREVERVIGDHNTTYAQEVAGVIEPRGVRLVEEGGGGGVKVEEANHDWPGTRID